jgi:hypothetical protein
MTAARSSSFVDESRDYDGSCGDGHGRAVISQKALRSLSMKSRLLKVTAGFRQWDVISKSRTSSRRHSFPRSVILILRKGH